MSETLGRKRVYLVYKLNGNLFYPGPDVPFVMEIEPGTLEANNVNMDEYVAMIVDSLAVRIHEMEVKEIEGLEIGWSESSPYPSIS